MSSNYEDELQVALQAVHRASIVTKNVMNGIQSVDKTDATPVTMADFAAQALIIGAIHHRFPDDRFVAEESADMLRENEPLLAQVWQLVETANSTVTGYSNHLYTPKTPEEMMQTIDLGSGSTTPTAGRIWILDPVDGTATFLKSQQYAVCLSLTLDGAQQLGVLGCPNLSPTTTQISETTTDPTGFGLLLSAVLSHGTHKSTMTLSGLSPPTRISRTPKTALPTLQFTDSIMSSHAHLPSHQQVYSALNLETHQHNIWSMQIKYAALALGSVDAMIRIPPSRSVRASVWDHAGGQLVFTESGGKIQDLDQKAFDFAKGRQFGQNWGFVAADPGVWDGIFAAVAQVLKERDA